MSARGYAVVLVRSTSHALRLEKLLLRAGIACKPIPVPRHLSSDCGVCVRITLADESAVRKVLEDNGMEIQGIHRI